MASLLLTVAGAALGNALLPGLGGAVLGAVGAMAGASIDNALFGSTAIKGPRLENLKVQDSSYGNGIPVIYGHVRVAGNVIWASAIRETLSEEETGGKGGAPSATIQRASYALDCAVALGLGPVGRIATIWADGKVIYSGGQWKAGTVLDAEFYTGTSAQNPSPLMEGALGSGNVPAYRGLAYVVLHQLQLAPFGNRLPNLSFEVEPAEKTLAPSFTGQMNTGLTTKPDTAAHPLGAPPIVLARRGENVSEVLVCAMTQNGTTYTFEARRYDVSGTAPVLLQSAGTASFNHGTDCNDFSCAPSPDGRTVALQAQFTNAGKTVRLALFDVAQFTFGALGGEDFTTLTQHKQLAWLDAQHFVLMDTVAGARGVRVYTAQGSTPVAQGFFDVWGVGSSSTRFAMKLTQFCTLPGGLFHIMVDSSTTPGNAYGKSLFWQGGQLNISSSMLVSNALAGFSATGSALLPLPEGDVLFARWSAGTLKMMSFVPGFAAVASSRGWASFSMAGNGMAGLCVRQGRAVYVQCPIPGAGYYMGEIPLTTTGFGSVTAALVTGGSGGVVDNFTPLFLSSSRLLLCAADSSGALSRLALFTRAGASTSLQNVVSDVLSRAGYAPADSSLTALSSVAVEGFVVNGPMPARAALEPLQVFEPFSLVESDGVLKAALLSATAVVTVASAETRAAQDGEEAPALVDILRGQAQDTPRELVVDYLDSSLDFQRGSQRARRMGSPARAQEKVSLPVVCTAAQAKSVAERQLFLRGMAQRRMESSLSRTYGRLDVGDVISLADETMRVEEIMQGGLLLKVKAAPVDTQLLSRSASAEAGNAIWRSVDAVTPTTFYLMDVPLLRGEDNQPGFYVAATGPAGWRGAGLWRAADGVTFSRIDTLSLPATAGVATQVLAAAPTEYMDRKNTLTLALLSGSLSSCDDSALLRGANALLVGQEIIQFKTAVLNADGSYTISQLLRGRRGTESACASHGAGENAVLLSGGVLHFLPLDSAARGITVSCRCVSAGQELDDAPSQLFTPGLKTLRPFSPAHLAVSRNTAGDASFTWKRRARLNAEWQDGVDVPLDEKEEKYEADILNGGSVVRSITGLTAPGLTYSAAQQVADFGVVQAAISLRVYQLGALYGRGAAASATL